MKFPDQGDGPARNFLSPRPRPKNFQSVLPMKFHHWGGSWPQNFQSPRSGPQNFQSSTLAPEPKPQFHKWEALARKFSKFNFSVSPNFANGRGGARGGLSTHFATFHDCITHTEVTLCNGVCKRRSAARTLSPRRVPLGDPERTRHWGERIQNRSGGPRVWVGTQGPARGPRIKISG